MDSPSWLTRRSRTWILGCFLLGFLVPAIVEFAAKRSDPYKLAVETAHRNPQFIDALGAPASEGWFFEEEEHLGNPVRAEMSIPVHGRTRTGTLLVQAIKESGHWRLTQLALELTKPDENTDLLSGKPL
jgi:Cytochrome oxidase complex assembly protein 1